jgi:hypothetical protein
MATRDGVEEYSTSPIAQRSSERSIRASWTTGYWGADASIRASIWTRLATTAATTVRASSPAAGSASTSARSRSRTAVGVRCPKSASNTADSATRRPARRLRTRSEGWSTPARLTSRQPPTTTVRPCGSTAQLPSWSSALNATRALRRAKAAAPSAKGPTAAALDAERAGRRGSVRRPLPRTGPGAAALVARSTPAGCTRPMTTRGENRIARCRPRRRGP